jgi:hypothetical protein
MANRTATKVSILSQVKTPIGLFALVVLVVEGILGAAVFRVSEDQRFYLALLMAVILLVVVAGVVWLSAHGKLPGGSSATGDALDAGAPSGATRRAWSFDVFVSAPMAAFGTDEEYKEMRAQVLRVVKTLRTRWKLKVFYAGESIESKKSFDKADAVAVDDLDAVRESRTFLMVYPAKLPTSTLVEAGYALATAESSVYFVRREDDLPYLLRHSVKNKRIPCRAIVYQEIGDVVAELEKPGAMQDLFEA